MAEYKLPNTRSMAELEGTYLFPKEGTPFNLDRFLTTAVPAGSRGPIVAVGNKLYESGDMTKPIKLWGNSSAVSLPYMDKSLAADAARKYRAFGMNYLRVHGPELYLMVGGAVNTSGSVIRGTRNYSAARWDELDFYLAEMVKAGIYISFGLMSSNLATDIGSTTDRWSSRKSSANDGGTITVVIAVDGTVTATCTAQSATPHYVPPAIYVNGAGGVGMKLRCTINGAGQVDNNIIVVDKGRGYTPGTYTNIARFYGGRGTLRDRMFLESESFARDEYAQTIYDVLNHYNPYLKCKYKDCPAVWLVEAYNESTFLADDHVTANGTNLYIPMWQEWLEKRYVTIGALNDKWSSGTPGTVNFASFADPALLPIAVSGAGGSGTNSAANYALRWRKSDTFYWRSEVDVKHFQFCEQAARAAGWTGLTSAADLYGNPAVARSNALSGAYVQNIHFYFSLNDDFTPGARITTGTLPINTTGARNPSGLTVALDAMDPDKPIVFTEINSPYPNRYRAEAGAIYAAMFGMYGVAAAAWHGDAPYALKWGGASINKGRSRGQWPLEFAHDPYGGLGRTFATISFLRGDVPERPVDKLRILNDRALSYHANLAEIPLAPFYDFKQMTPTVESRVVGMVGRVNTKYYPSSDPIYGTQQYANDWQASINRSASLQVKDVGAGGDTDTWLSAAPGNNTTTGESLYNAVIFQKGYAFFCDLVAGVSGMSTARLQTATVCNQLMRKSGSKNRRGRGFYDAGLLQAHKGVRSAAYNRSCLGRRFWENLEINQADDGVFIGISSFDDSPITGATRLLVGCGGRTYNTGASWQSSNKTIASVSVDDNKGIVFSAPPVITADSGTNNTAEQGNEFFAIGVLSNGATGTLLPGTAGVRILNGGNNYPNTTTVSVAGQPSIVLSRTLVDDDPQKEIRILAPYASDGNEGSPILQSCIVADFIVRGVDMGRPWVLREYDFEGNAVGVHPAVNVPAKVVDGEMRPAGVRVRIETLNLVKPSLYFVLEQSSGVARRRRTV